MMLPSAAPTVSLFAHLRGTPRAGPFVLGYLVAWTGGWVAASPASVPGLQEPTQAHVEMQR